MMGTFLIVLGMTFATFATVALFVGALLLSLNERWLPAAACCVALVVCVAAFITVGIHLDEREACPPGTTREYKPTGYHYCLAREPR